MGKKSHVGHWAQQRRMICHKKKLISDTPSRKTKDQHCKACKYKSQYHWGIECDFKFLHRFLFSYILYLFLIIRVSIIPVLLSDHLNINIHCAINSFDAAFICVLPVCEIVWCLWKILIICIPDWDILKNFQIKFKGFP